MMETEGEGEEEGRGRGEGGEGRGGRERFEDATLLAVTMGKGTCAKECRQCLKARKHEETASSLKGPG